MGIVFSLAQKVHATRRNFRVCYYDDPELAVLVPESLRDSVLTDEDINRYWASWIDPDQVSILGARVAWVTNLTEPLVVIAPQ